MDENPQPSHPHITGPIRERNTPLLRELLDALGETIPYLPQPGAVLTQVKKALERGRKLVPFMEFTDFNRDGSLPPFRITVQLSGPSEYIEDGAAWNWLRTLIICAGEKSRDDLTALPWREVHQDNPVTSPRQKFPQDGQ
ncbi:MAG: hypothetical protein M0R06_08170 [Sphaerochaeta sp.]|nr:hypothetical protein [Sphaerochaeta sp.]